MARNVGDRTQHQRRRHRQFEGERERTEKAADAAARARQQRGGGARRLRPPAPAERADGDAEAGEDRLLDRLGDAVVDPARDDPQRAVDWLAGVLGDPRGEIGTLEEIVGASQREFASGRERLDNRRRRHW
jgi:hypothetical protein